MLDRLFKNFDNFISSIFVNSIFPLLPIIAELIFTEKLTPDATCITASTYSVAIGLSSKFKSAKVIGYIGGILNAAGYGSYLKATKTLGNEQPIFKISIIFIIIGLFASISECFLKHILHEEPFDF